MTKGHASSRRMERESGSATESFSGSVGVRELEGYGGEGDGQGGDVGDGVEVFGT